MSKFKEKEKAISLRKKGLSYNEILKNIPVAKSTLSLWLRSVGLSKEQKQKLTKKKLAAALKGAKVRKDQRLDITKEIKDKAKNEIGKLSNRELWLIGTALYWGEGGKERQFGSLLIFGNSDANMIKLYLKWLKRICGVNKKDIHFRIYLHKTSKYRLKIVQKYWAKVTNFSEINFQKITWKKNKINTNRKNIGDNYYGLISIIVKKSTNLNRKVQGWIEGIYKHCRVV